MQRHGTCVVTMSAAQSVTATFTLDPVFHALSVSKAGTGSGTVTSDPGGINCGATCAASYLADTVVTLTASPAAGSSFAGWSGAVQRHGHVRRHDERGAVGHGDLHARSGVPRLVGEQGRHGQRHGDEQPGWDQLRRDVRGELPGRYGRDAHGDARRPGSTFAGWSGACSGTGTCVVTMSAAQSVTATFTLDPVFHALTVSKTGTGSGTVTSNPAGINCGATCAASYLADTVVTLTASAGGRDRPSRGGAAPCSGTGACVVTMSAAQSVTATFTLECSTPCR